MQSQREFPCSDLQFFNYIARRICRDVQMETGRKIELRQLEEGFQYEGTDHAAKEDCGPDDGKRVSAAFLYPSGI